MRMRGVLDANDNDLQSHVNPRPDPRGGIGPRFTAAIATAWAQTAGAQEDLPSREEMWQIIQSQQSQINELTSRLDNTQRQTTETQVQVEQTQQQLEETDDKVEATADLLESDDYAAGTGWWDRTSIGAYGELHYNGGMTDEIDLHRFVVFLGHELIWPCWL